MKILNQREKEILTARRLAEDPKTLKSPKEVMNAYLFLMGIDSLNITGKSIEAQ